MKSFLSKEESEELESLKQDLVGPVKSFLAEVREDTVGDAKRFYSARAQKAQQEVKLAQERTQARLNAVRQEQEALRKRRKAMMKRATIILVLLGLFSLLVISAALAAHAEVPVNLRSGEACLSVNPLDYEGAARCFRPAEHFPGSSQEEYGEGAAIG